MKALLHILRITAVLGLATSAAGAVPTPPAVGQPEAQLFAVTGLVVDASGAPVPGATVTVEPSTGRPVSVQTGADGRFVIETVPPGLAAVTASAPGFDDARENFQVGPGATNLRLVLRPPGLSESISVTASRGARGLEAPASVSVVTASQLASSAGSALDDVLRSTPGFSLFRRSSSRVANPTTQGVTLRGLSGSGASRTLVLADGTPLNDPFGSWVYWNRVPLAAIDRVEVVRGAASDLYGADALGGVIQVLTFPPDRPRLRATVEGASHETARASVFASGAARGWTLAGAGEWLETDGVPVVAPDERGLVDVPAYGDYRTAFAAIGYAREAWRADLRGSGQDEQRGNGTPLQVNDTSWSRIVGSLAGPGGGGFWSVQIATGSQTYSQTFSAISASRQTERLTSAQEIPTTFARATGQWVRPAGRHAVMVGAEGTHTSAEVRETRYSISGAASGPFVTGGSEASGAAYARLNLAPRPSLSMTAGVRMDVWRSDPLEPGASHRDANVFSPRFSVSWSPGPSLAVHASAYRAFRPPTLNELHRGFRAGNVVTNPNQLLEPERLTGVEGGALVTGGRATARLTGFFTHLTDAVSNVTILTTPVQIVRERQNTDTVRAAGVECEAELRPNGRVTISGLAVFTASHFVRTPAQPLLEGNRIPQVPRYQLGASVAWADPHVVTLVADVRAYGMQFDDDQNTLELRSFVVVDASATRTLTRVLHAFAAIENLFDVEYDVGRTPVRAIGWPRTMRAGVRVFLP